MIDWYVWLAPLLVLPIAALLIFVGCSLTHNPLSNVLISLAADPSIGISGATFTFNVAGGANTSVTLPLPMGTMPPMTTYGVISAPTGDVARGHFSILISGRMVGRWTVRCTATLHSTTGNTTLTCPTDPYIRNLVNYSTSTTDTFAYGIDTTPTLQVGHRFSL